MVLKIEHPQFFYDLFYQMSFVVVLVIFLIEGIRRKLPLTSLLLIVVTTRFFSLTGSAIAALNAEDFKFFFHHFSFPPEHSRNMIGVFAFGILGLIVAKILLQIKYPVLDVFAVAVPFGMAIQRVGCLFAGCCFGRETSLPIGIQYGANTPAFLHQFYSQRVGLTDELSLHIHPVPFYLILHSLLVGILLLKYRNLWKRPGNLALSGLFLILVGWFFIEIVRDPLSNGALGDEIFWGMKRIQLIYLISSAVLFFVIFYREKRVHLKAFVVSETPPLQNSLYLLFLIGLMFITRKWFSPIELSVILFVLVPAVIGTVVQIVRQFYTPTVKASVTFFVLLSFVLMAQTLPEKQVYKSVKFGFSSGGFDTYHNIGTGKGCDRVSQSQYFYQKYRMAGGGYSITNIQGNVITEYGLNGYIGSHTEIGETSKLEKTATIFGLNPFIKYDKKWYGIGGGIHLGALRFSPPEWVEQSASVLPETGTKESPIMPQLYFRVGPQNIAFVSYKFADQFPSPFPGLYQIFELGSGFGLKNGFNIRFGTNFDEGAHLAAYIPIQNRMVIEPFFQWGNSTSENNEYSVNVMFSIGLQYRFGQKIKK